MLRALDGEQTYLNPKRDDLAALLLRPHLWGYKESTGLFGHQPIFPQSFPLPIAWCIVYNRTCLEYLSLSSESSAVLLIFQSSLSVIIAWGGIHLNPAEQILTLSQHARAGRFLLASA